MPDLHPSTVEAIQTLRERYPDTSFLTLGQTVLWDEPVKAAFCRILEQVAPEAQIVAAVHDTDYFAKLPTIAEADEKFVLLPHNDGSTRGLWSAAGEISSLFGSETVPTRHLLTENGVAFDRVAKAYPGGGNALLENETAAWGWRALVHTEPHPLIAADVKLKDIAPTLREQISWALAESAQITRQADAPIAQQLLQWTDEYANANPQASLSDLYQFLTPKLWSAVRGSGSCNLETGASLQLFQFNTQTCARPRFNFLQLFLNPETSDIARRCYDEAVQGSGIYQLAQFGEGALPFDVVIPGRGRGTLRIYKGNITVETETPLTICNGCNPQSTIELAHALETQLGPNVVLVGKAVALISMLSAEYIFIFHEKASSYTARTQVMNQRIREHGIALELHPMLRLRYATLDALSGVEADLQLPPHLAHAFGNNAISAADFGTRWRQVCDEQDALRRKLKACASPRDLMQFLAEHHNDANWRQALEEYSQARKSLNSLRAQTVALENEVEALRQRAAQANDEATQLETQKGEHWRTEIQPLRTRIMDIKQVAFERLEAAARSDVKPTKEERKAQAEEAAREAAEIAELQAALEAKLQQRAALWARIEELRNNARDLRDQARTKTQQRVALERNEETRAVRSIIAQREYEAELQRLRLVRDAIFTSDGLRYINYRPTGWWLPLVSPDGAWFQGLVQTAQARIEDL